MSELMRSWGKALLPPALVQILRPWCGPLRWTGDHADWADAVRRCRGYGDPAILDRVEAAVRAVLAGEARYERDSVLFHDDEQRWPLLAAAGLARARAGHLRTVDVGGSLGSAWLQHRTWLTDLGADWRIVEQPAFVARGRILFAGLPVAFHETLDAACADGEPALAVLSGVLPFVADPPGLIGDLLARRPAVIYIDHTVTHDADRDRIAIQHVAPRIYPAAYPCRIFARDAIPRLIGPDYVIAATVINEYRPQGLTYAGWVFARRDAPDRPA